MKFMFIIIIIALFYIFRKERFELDDVVRTISADRWADIIKHDRKYINQIDYYKDAPQINLERAISSSPITTDDINWSKLNDYEYSVIVGLLQGNYNRDSIKSINAG
jgi:hypothetical protein